MISITLNESTWNQAIEMLLKSDNKFLQMFGQTLLTMLVMEKNLEHIKEKAGL